VCTRRNHPGLRFSHSDYVRNGYRWHVQRVHHDGRLTVRHIGNRRVTTLPAAYVLAHTTLGYASTIDTAQGITADICHGVLTGTETRARAYWTTPGLLETVGSGEDQRYGWSEEVPG
jgi:hypothetical protein